jgi:hypothetical protein
LAIVITLLEFETFVGNISIVSLFVVLRVNIALFSELISLNFKPKLINVATSDDVFLILRLSIVVELPLAFNLN